MLMARPGGDNAQKDDVPWWMRYGGRGLGTVGGFSSYYFAINYILYTCHFDVTNENNCMR